MLAPRHGGGPFPTEDRFAFRLYLCLNALCGRLSKTDFHEWFDLTSPRAQRAYTRLAFRTWFTLHLRRHKKVRRRWRSASPSTRRRYFTHCHRRFCQPYRLYRVIFREGVSFRQFAAYWRWLGLSDRVRVIDAWYLFIKSSGYHVRLTSLSADAHIVIRVAGGADSGLPRVF